MYVYVSEHMFIERDIGICGEYMVRNAQCGALHVEL